MMKSKNVELVGAFLLSIIGVIHLILMRGEYDEAHYLGMLFAASFFGAVVAAVGIFRGSIWGWVLGFLVAAGSFVGFILSRTLGLPGMNIETWLNPFGIVSLFMEVVFFALVIFKAPWKGLVRNFQKN
jgi:hypothetical protein